LPRPYFYEKSYIPTSCSFEYGNPSGHGQVSTSFYLAGIYVLLEYLDIKSKTIKAIIYILTTSFCAFVGFT